METCYALAKRGHSVDLIVRPDTHDARARSLYLLRTDTGFATTRGTRTGRRTCDRETTWLSVLSLSGGQSERKRADVLLTRDLGVASAILQLPRAVAAATRLRIARLCARRGGRVARARRDGDDRRRRENCSGSPDAKQRVWQSADGYVTITAALGAELESRFGRRPRTGRRTGRRAVARSQDRPHVDLRRAGS